jgi:alkyldihydroxyacetonephosphate synthase
MGERSVWGWGHQDQLPAPPARAQLVKLLQAQLGFGPVEPLPEPTDLTLAPPRIEPPAHLASLFEGDDRARALRTHGRSYPDQIRGLLGDYANAPDWVVTPGSTDDIRAVLAWAQSAGVAVVPYGGGTSVVGGTEAKVSDRWAATVCLDMRRFDQVEDIDVSDRLVCAQAGMKGPALEAALAPHGLTLRHYPQSFEFSTVGGWVATRAGGHFATVYTHIDDLVAGSTMVTPQGVLETRPLPGSGAGPSPDRMVLGSEGALGVITRAWLRLHKRPVFRASTAVRFRDWDAAVSAVQAIAQAKLFPANCRLLDSREAFLNQVDLAGNHVLLLGFESADHPVGDALQLALTHCSAGGADAPTVREGGQKGRAGQANAWRQSFLQAPYLFSGLVQQGVLVDTFETACRWSDFPSLHAAIVRGVRGVLKEQCGAAFLSCRFTHVYPDGPAPYYTFLAPATPGRWLEQWHAVKAVASQILVDHGATITHHHAVGRAHMPWYRQQRSPVFARALAGAKAAVDPKGVMNPGVLVDEPPGS